MKGVNLLESFGEFKEFKNIDRPTVISVLEEVFRSMLRKKYGTDENCDVIVNPDNGDLEIWRTRTVMEDGFSEDDDLEIELAEAKVIDSAYSIGVVSPNTRNIYLIALLLGLLIPFSVIYLIQLLDTKIHSRHDLEKYLKLPFLGDIPLSETSDEIMTSESRSSTAESFRILLTAWPM